MASTAGAFAQRKAQTLAELAADSGDFSRAGHVDERARPIVGLVNRHPSFFTTSSCAGRVSLFADPTTATRAAGMKGGEWVYVNHDPADADAIVAAVRRKLGEDEDGGEGMDPECTLVLRFEPFILSVEASTLEEGARLVAAARDAGYRESGITASDKRFILAVRCSIRMEVPVVSCGERLVTDDALRRLVSIANDKHAANSSRAERLMERFIAVFGDELEAPATRGGDGRAGEERGDEAGETSESALHIEGDLERLAALEGASAVDSIDEPGAGKRVRLTEPNGYQVEVVHGVEAVAPIAVERDVMNTGDEPLRRANRLLRLPSSPSPVKRIGIERFLRNLAICLGNSGHEKAREPLQQLARSENAVVAESAQWALTQLSA